MFYIDNYRPNQPDQVIPASSSKSPTSRSETDDVLAVIDSEVWGPGETQLQTVIHYKQVIVIFNLLHCRWFDFTIGEENRVQQETLPAEDKSSRSATEIS